MCSRTFVNKSSSEPDVAFQHSGDITNMCIPARPVQHSRPVSAPTRYMDALLHRIYRNSAHDPLMVGEATWAGSGVKILVII